MKRISLTQGQVALVDDEDYNYLIQWKWCAKKDRPGKFYAGRTQRHRIILMHRVLMNAKKGQEVDHKNGDTLNNRRYNLRLCTSGQNNQNSMSRKNSSSRYKGVCFSNHARKWQVEITHKGKHHYLGYYDSEEEAARTYDKFARIYFREFARTNFPRRIARKNGRNK